LCALRLCLDIPILQIENFIMGESAVKSTHTLRILALATILPVASFAQSLSERDVNQFVGKVLKQFNVPGVAVAIVKDGKVLLTNGYGVKTAGTQDRVDARTLFGIASNTKAFTATALALLVEEGKLEWDTPVIRYLPAFALSDPYVTRELTIRDLLVHRSGLGLGAGDLLWWPASTYDRKQIVHRLRYIPLATSFRSAYAYDNVLYSVAGEVIETVSGKSWEEFVSTRILAKVGMTHSVVSYPEDASGMNIATPHASINGVVRPVQPDTSANTNPAGGIMSCAEDIAKWMIVQLDSGRVAGSTPLFSPRTTRQLWQIVTPLGSGPAPAQLAPLQSNFNGYALGFGIRDFRGKKIVSHTGGLPGYVSRVSMIPELKTGVAIFTNQEAGAAFETLTYHLLDKLMVAPAFDWLGGFTWLVARQDSLTAAAEIAVTAARDTISRPSLPLAKYAGTYTDAWYGNVIITEANGKLGIRFAHTPSLVGDLVHWQYDTFIARWHDPEMRADAYVTFSLTPEGSIEQAKMKAVSPATDFSFDFHDLLLKPTK